MLVRAYQLAIIQSAFFRNVLAVVPTGLGKTYIASVVMVNCECDLQGFQVP